MALTTLSSGHITTDGTAQVLFSSSGLTVEVAEMDLSPLAPGDVLVVRWRISLYSVTLTVWETTITADGTQEGLLSPPIPLPFQGGSLEIEQTAGTLGVNLGWNVLSL